MVPWKLGGRKNFASMNSSGNTWPQTRIRARLSPTRRRVTTAWTLARRPSFPATARNSARRVSKTGSLSPRRKRRRANSWLVAKPDISNHVGPVKHYFEQTSSFFLKEFSLSPFVVFFVLDIDDHGSFVI